MFDRPAAGACGNVNGLMLEVFNEPQIFEAVVGLVTVDVVEMHIARNGTVSSTPDDAVLEVTDAGPDVDADIAHLVIARSPAPPVREQPFELMRRRAAGTQYCRQ